MKRASYGYAGPSRVSSGKKIRMRTILKENMHGKLYISLKRLLNVDLGKKYELVFFLNSAKENCKNYRENDHESFNPINELMGYQNSADFCEIWPEHSLDVVKPNYVGIFEIYNIPAVAIFIAMRIAYSVLFELDRLIKKLITSQNIEKCSHTFDD